jgi:hypothetical protein
MGMSNWIVRYATEEDKQWVKAQCKAFLGTLPMNIPYDDARMDALWAMPGLSCIIVEKDDVPHGLGVYTEMPHLFNQQIKTFTELVWWVCPEYRGTRAGLILLDAMDKVADGSDVAVFSTEANSPITSRALTRRGYVPQEQAFVKRN